MPVDKSKVHGNPIPTKKEELDLSESHYYPGYRPNSEAAKGKAKAEDKGEIQEWPIIPKGKQPSSSVAAAQSNDGLDVTGSEAARGKTKADTVGLREIQGKIKVLMRQKKKSSSVAATAGGSGDERESVRSEAETSGTESMGAARKAEWGRTVEKRKTPSSSVAGTGSSDNLDDMGTGPILPKFVGGEFVSDSD